MLNHLSHHSGWSPSDTPESWDNGQPGWIPYHEVLPRHFGGLFIFSSAGITYDQEGGSLASARGPPGLLMYPSGGPPGLTGSPGVPPDLSGPPRGGSSGNPDDVGSQGPPSHSCGKVVLH